MLIDENFIKNNLNKSSIQYLFSFIAPNFNMFLTTADVDILHKNRCYKSGICIKNVSINDTSNIEDISVQLLNNYDGNRIYAEQLLQAKVDIKMYFTDGIDETSFIMFNGFVSEIIEEGNLLSILISSIVVHLKTNIGELFSPLCRACFGDKRCGVSLESLKVTGKILTIASEDCFIGDHQTFKKTGIGYYKYGLVKFLTGKLSGICLQLRDEEDGKVFLLKNTKLLSVNDKYEIFPGCDKTQDTCREKFANIVNFRGEPFIG